VRAAMRRYNLYWTIRVDRRHELVPSLGARSGHASLELVRTSVTFELPQDR
jgi:hypothetical protein